jgi:hypothetical protein
MSQKTVRLVVEKIAKGEFTQTHPFVSEMIQYSNLYSHRMYLDMGPEHITRYCWHRMEGTKHWGWRRFYLEVLKLILTELGEEKLLRNALVMDTII